MKPQIMHSVYYKIIAATIVIVTAAFVFAPRTDGQGGPGTINQLDQWRFDGTNVTQNVANTPVRITGLENEDCLGTNASGVLQAGTCTGGGGGSGTVTSVGLAVPTGLTVSGSPVTTSGTLTIGLAGGYVIPLTASTSQWSAAFASTTALTPAYIRSLFSETVNGLDYSSGVLSLTSGFTIPLTASTSQWQTAFSWGNHATAGYLTSIATSTVRGMFSASSPLSYNSSTGAFTLLTSGDWTGTFDGQEGTWYRDRANHTGTQLASTISDFTATARNAISETVTGLTYTSGTGVLSLDGGFTIPLTASTTNWNAFYDTPSTRITAGANCSWTGNTFNCTGGGGGGGGLATTSPWTLGNLAFVTGQGTVGSVATGTLTENVTGLEFDATRALVGGSAVLGLTSGFTIPLAASATDWTTFRNTPSTRITAGTGLSWAGNTLNAHVPVTVSGALDYITLVGQDIVRGAIDLATDITGVLSLANGGTGANLSDPNADRILFWDDSANATTWLTLGTNLSITGTTINATGGGGGGGLSTTSPWTVGNLAFVTGQGTVGSIATTTLVAGTGITFTGGTPVVVGSTPITIEATGGGGGGGGALSTTTDQIGDGGVQLVSYVTGDVMFGGSASTSAEFQFDDDGAKFFISSTSNQNATATIESTNNAQAVRIGDDIGRGLEWFFGTVGQVVVRAYGAITDLIFNFNVAVTGRMYVATTTYYGATSTVDALIVPGYINSGEWTEVHCNAPTAEGTQIVADTIRGCERYAYIEDGTAVIDLVAPTTGTSSYFRIRGNNTIIGGDGMGIGWVSGLDFGDIQRHQPVVEWAWRQDIMANATGTIIVGGLTDRVGLATDFGQEPAQGFYVIATSTTPNYVFACNPPTGSTIYVNTGIASSTTTVAGANPFTHWRVEVTGTTNTTINGRVLVRTVTNQNFTEVGNCAINVSASTQLVAPTVAFGKIAAGLAPEIHVMFLKFWYRHSVF